MPYPNYPQVTAPGWNNTYTTHNTITSSPYFPPQPPNYLPVGFHGRFIDDISTVQAQEVPMDGVGSIFVKGDRSVIYTKNWMPDGTIETVQYVKADISPEEKSIKDSDLAEIVQSMQERIARLEQSNEDRKRQAKRDRRVNYGKEISDDNAES